MINIDHVINIDQNCITLMVEILLKMKLVYNKPLKKVMKTANEIASPNIVESLSSNEKDSFVNNLIVPTSNI